MRQFTVWVFNELIHRRVTGEQLVIFVEMVTNELKKVFNYYRNDGSNYLKKEKYNESFCLKVDRLFLDLYNELVSQAYHSQQISEYLFDHNILVPSAQVEKEEEIQKKLLNLGIKGLLICGCGGDKPIAFRNYENKTFESENNEGAYFVCGLSHLLNKFALTNFGFFTDVGFGFQRVIFKFKTENKITLCLILSEVMYRRLTGETLNMFSELMLTRVHNSLKTSIPKLRELSLISTNDPLLIDTRAKLDAILLHNAKTIYQEMKS